MSYNLDNAVSVLNEKFKSASISETIKFIIDGEGAITVRDGVASLADEDADMTMTATADVFQDILEGNLSGAAAFMMGKLKVDGDMGLAMKLGSVLG